MIQVLPAKSGKSTILVEHEGRQIYLHSRYNPLKEAEDLVRGWNIPKNGMVIVYGLGCGHHLREILKKLSFERRLIVIESNKEVVDKALEQQLITDLLKDSRFELQVPNTIHTFADKLSDYFESLNAGVASFFVHGPSLKVIPKAFSDIKNLIEQYQVLSTSTSVQRKLLTRNLLETRDFLHSRPNVGRSKGLFYGIPSILVAAGPSLDETLPDLLELQEKALIISVGTALSSLLRHGIRPDFCVVIEADTAVLRQFIDVDQSIPLIAFPTTSPQLTLNYRGPVIWAFPEGIEELKQEALNHNFSFVKSGGSVATAALSIAELLGCNPIVLTGFDFAYVNGRTHVTGSMYENEKVNSSAFVRYTEAVGGGQVPTSTSWEIFRMWVEQFVTEHSSISFYNASRGARIKGTIEKPLVELIDEGVFVKSSNKKNKIHELLMG